VADPDAEVRSSGRVHSAAFYRSDYDSRLQPIFTHPGLPEPDRPTRVLPRVPAWNSDIIRYVLRRVVSEPWRWTQRRYSNMLKKSNKMRQYADIYLLPNYSTCFRRPSRPSSGVLKTVVAASGTDHTIWEASFFKRDQIRIIWSRLKKLAPHIVWSVPEAATTVLCTPDDGRDGRPKHVEEFSIK